MKTMVIYDSLHGNTGMIGQAIGDGLAEALAAPESVDVRQLSKTQPDQLAGLDLLVVGAPTHGCRPSPPAREFLKRIPANALKDVKIAAFDTRFDMDKMDSYRFVGKVLDFLGYAAPRISSSLEKNGGEVVMPPEGFFVEDTEGPLEDGELERAMEWGREIVAKTRG
jgi:flavodoxin